MRRFQRRVAVAESAQGSKRGGFESCFLHQERKEMEITRERLITELLYYRQHGAGEEGHSFLDDLLLAYIDDDEITELWHEIPDMWYA